MSKSFDYNREQPDPGLALCRGECAAVLATGAGLDLLIAGAAVANRERCPGSDGAGSGLVSGERCGRGGIAAE